MGIEGLNIVSKVPSPSSFCEMWIRDAKRKLVDLDIPFELIMQDSERLRVAFINYLEANGSGNLISFWVAVENIRSHHVGKKQQLYEACLDVYELYVARRGIQRLDSELLEDKRMLSDIDRWFQDTNVDTYIFLGIFDELQAKVSDRNNC